jgi:hypothetical protein
MLKKSLILATTISAITFVSQIMPASATTIQRVSDETSRITGIKDLEISGKVYDVNFVYTVNTISSNFTSLLNDPNSPIHPSLNPFWNNSQEAVAASAAIVNALNAASPSRQLQATVLNFPAVPTYNANWFNVLYGIDSNNTYLAMGELVQQTGLWEYSKIPLKGVANWGNNQVFATFSASSVSSASSSTSVPEPNTLTGCLIMITVSMALKKAKSK